MELFCTIRGMSGFKAFVRKIIFVSSLRGLCRMVPVFEALASFIKYLFAYF